VTEYIQPKHSTPLYGYKIPLLPTTLIKNITVIFIQHIFKSDQSPIAIIVTKTIFLLKETYSNRNYIQTEKEKKTIYTPHRLTESRT
jgi:hypothetical protein